MKPLALLLCTVLFTSCRSAPAFAASDAVSIVRPKESARVADLRGRSLEDAQAVAGVDSLAVNPAQRNLRQHSEVVLGTGEFVLRATVVIDEFNGRGAAIAFDGGTIALDDREWGAVLGGRLFGGGRFPFETERPTTARPGAPLEVEIVRVGGELIVRLNEFEMGRIGMKGFALGRIGFDLAAGGMRVLACSVEGDCSTAPRPRAVYSSADGDIDEYRDPSIASDGVRMLVSAVAVQTADDGSTKNSLWIRCVSSEGKFSDPYAVDLGEVQPDLALLGFASGSPRPWKLLVQEPTKSRLVERLVAFDSTDGRSFARTSIVDSSGAPLQLMAGSLSAQSSGLVAGGTRVRAGTPRAVSIRCGTDGAWKLEELVDEPSCEPMWLGEGWVVWRKPRTAERSSIRASERSAVTGLDGGATALGVVAASDARVAVALAEAAFPYPLLQFASVDRGKTWTLERTVWGGSAGHAHGCTVGSKRYLLFEGGDKARREHVLLLEVPAVVAPAAAPTAAPTAAPSASR